MSMFVNVVERHVGVDAVAEFPRNFRVFAMRVASGLVRH